jgi:hypothetical protein
MKLRLQPTSHPSSWLVGMTLAKISRYACDFNFCTIVKPKKKKNYLSSFDISNFFSESFIHLK